MTELEEADAALAEAKAAYEAADAVWVDAHATVVAAMERHLTILCDTYPVEDERRQMVQDDLQKLQAWIARDRLEQLEREMKATS